MKLKKPKHIKGKVLYGWEKESLWEKTKWFLTLTPLQRYTSMLSMQELFNAVKHHPKPKKDARRSFKTVQILG